MKRKIIAVMLFVVLLLLSAGLVSCSIPEQLSGMMCQHRDADDDGRCDKCDNEYSDGNDLEHFHSFTEKNIGLTYLATEATCKCAATYYWSCKCGEKTSETFTHGSPNGHSYTEMNTDEKYLAAAATCTNAAIYYHSCICGEKGNTVFVNGTGKEHNYVIENTDEKYLYADASCERAAIYYHSCICGKKGETTFNYGDPKGHEYNQLNTDSAYLSSEATCVAPPYYYFSCLCGKKGENTFAFGVQNDKAHAFGEAVYIWSSDNTKCTATRTCIHNALHIESETVVSENNDDKYTASFTNPAFSEQIVYGEYNYSWAQTEVLFELNEHSNSDELESGVRRYYAGTDVGAVYDIDISIRTRNRDALNKTKVTPKFTYLADGNKEYSWGANVGRIQQLTNVGGSNCPDVFVNFAYDLTCAQLRGCFANLLDTSWGGGNHFYFANLNIPNVVDKFASGECEGYFYEYMKSLSLTPDTKLYCLASNYCIDLLRAMIVIPVNVELMNGITTLETKDGLAGDRDNDGDHDITDFYNLVWNNEWTYTALAAYSNTVYVGNTLGGVKTDFADDVVGFMLGTNSGLSGAAMLYTSSVQIIGKNAEGKYEYPATNPGLTEFASALAKLMTDNAVKGICTVDRATAAYFDPAAFTELIGIRHKFAGKGLLFGGTIMVGSLEDTDYQEMRRGQGFGFVPVPLYKAYEEDVNEYRTLVHNMARIIAIAKCSTEKAQASAYLDYQSRNSGEIVEKYAAVQLTSSAGGVSGDNNVKMFNFIKNAAGNCFDKTFEDMVADYTGDTDSTAVQQRWHYMLQSNKFVMPNIAAQYNSYYLNKQKGLDAVYEAWNGLE